LFPFGHSNAFKLCPKSWFGGLGNKQRGLCI
jgi:hypothetical protein